MKIRERSLPGLVAGKLTENPVWLVKGNDQFAGGVLFTGRAAAAIFICEICRRKISAKLNESGSKASYPRYEISNFRLPDAPHNICEPWMHKARASRAFKDWKQKWKREC